ncbi:MAG: hypothetical protein ACLGIE_18340, partial [Alphaproteobacteria bacterium]
RQRHDLYAKYHDYDSEISDLLGECGMQMAFEEVFPGFVWLDSASVFLGLFWTVFYEWYIAVLFVPIRNYFFRQFA